MIRVTEALDGENTARFIHTFQEAVSFDTGRHGELLVYGPADSTHPQGETIAAFAENCWDIVEVNPTDGAPLMMVPPLRSVPTESSAPSTIGPSTSPDALDMAQARYPAGPDTPGGPLSEAENLHVATGVMTSEQTPAEALAGAGFEQVFGSGYTGEPKISATAADAAGQPGIPVDDNTKVVMDGQGNPIVLRKVTRPDGTETFVTLSPDDIPAGVAPALIEDRSPAQQ